MKNITLLTIIGSALLLTGCETTTNLFSNLPFVGPKSETNSLSAKAAMPMRDKDDMKKSKDDAEEKKVKPSKNEAVVEPVDEAPEAAEERRKMEEEKRKARDKDKTAILHEVESIAEETGFVKTSYQATEDETTSWEK